MTLGEKLRYLREVEGTLRGLDRELAQLEMARLIQNWASLSARAIFRKSKVARGRT